MVTKDYCITQSTTANHLHDSQSFEFLICILQALNMPLIRCTNVFYQGKLSRYITSPSEKTRLESLPVDNMGKATLNWLACSRLKLKTRVTLVSSLRQLRPAVVIIPTLPRIVTCSRNKPQKTPSVEKHAHPPRVVYCAI